MSIPMGSDYSPATGRVDFGWIGQAWTLLTAQLGVWIGTTLLCGLVSLLVYLLAAIPTGVLATLQQAYRAAVTHTVSPGGAANSFQHFAGAHLLAIIVGGVWAVLYGGLYRTALRQIRGEPISALGVFSALPQAPALLGVGVITPILIAALEGLCVWVLHLASLPMTIAVSLANTLGLLPNLILQGLLMFAPLLVLDRRANVADAARGSIGLLRGQTLIGVLFYVAVAFLSGLGAIACGVGMLFTFPLFVISIAVGYQSLTQPPLLAQYPPYGAYPAPPGVWPPPPTV